MFRFSTKKSDCYGQQCSNGRITIYLAEHKKKGSALIKEVVDTINHEYLHKAIGTSMEKTPDKINAFKKKFFDFIWFFDNDDWECIPSEERAVNVLLGHEDLNIIKIN